MKKQEFNTDQYITYLRGLHQEGPHLGNQYLEDSALLSYIKYLIPQNILKEQENNLIELGDKVAGEMNVAKDDCEANPPKLQTHNAFGKRINKVVLGWGWRQQRVYAAKYHIVGSAYKGQGGDYKRLFQAIRMYLYHPSSGMYGCPLAMTDGAAYVLKNILENDGSHVSKKTRNKMQKTYDHLTSNDPEQFWTSGQWMTEKRGGTDVGQTTETIAIQYKEDKFKLFGYKFFCSAADCNVTLALARIIDPSIQYTPEQIRKLPISMFLLKLKKKNGDDNGLEYQSLKEKLGTRQLPTAEMILNGTKATLISPQGRGIKFITHMLQTTRLYNSASAVGIMRRMIALARDYSNRRSVFGKQLMDHPMHQKLLSDLEITFRGNLIFYLNISSLFSKVQEGTATQDEINLNRIGSPLLKMFTAKELQFVSGECVEIFGGIGYCENSGLPQLSRDGQVLSIWEGTTNVMSHDFHRSITSKKDNPIDSFSRFVTKVLMDNVGAESKASDSGRMKQSVKSLVLSYNELIADINTIITDKKQYENYYEFFMRDIAMGTARIFVAVLFLEHFLRSGESWDLEIFQRWVNMKPLYNIEKKLNIPQNIDIGMDKEINGKLKGNGDVDFRGKLRPKF